MNKIGKRIAAILNGTYAYKVLSYWYYRPKKNDEILSEEYKTYGFEYEDKTFYVIRVNDPEGDNGLMAIVGYCLGHIRIARKKRCIPIIDMQNFPNIYVGTEDIGKYNAWEFFFEQPEDYYLSDITNAKNVILSSTRFPMDRPVFSSKRIYNDIQGELGKWRKYAKQYMRLNSVISNEIEKKWNDFFDKGDRVLGVLCRGTDYSSLKIEGHPIQPTWKQIQEKMVEFIKKYNLNKIYLATEDKNAFEYFKTEFGEMLFINNPPSINYRENEVISSAYPDETVTKRNIGENYLVSLGLLSRCNSFICGRNGGSLGTLLLSDGFESMYCFDLGLY